MHTAWQNPLNKPTDPTVLQGVLGIGAISLLVALLVLQILWLCQFKRTKEIGIMKVIGSRIKDIRRVFI